MSERRSDARIAGPFEGHWHGGSGANEVRISDMSLGGCFVETLMQPVAGEETDVTVLFADGQSITLRGASPTWNRALDSGSRSGR